MRLLTRLAGRFVAGEAVEDAVSVVRELNQDGLLATLDHLGENVSDPDRAKEAGREYAALLKRIAEEKLDCNISIKLSQLGLALSEELARRNLESLLEEASRLGNFVRIDMEGSDLTDKTLGVFRALHGRFKNVGVVIQASLKRSREDVMRLVDLGARVRLCKGAYKEPPQVAYQDKRDVDSNYDLLAKLLLRAPRPAFATHDDERIVRAVAAASAAGLKPGDYEIQMLYGLRPRRWRELAAQGHAVRIYVPYGAHWMPYFYRRLRERKENALFVLRNLFRN